MTIKSKDMHAYKKHTAQADLPKFIWERKYNKMWQRDRKMKWAGGPDREPIAGEADRYSRGGGIRYDTLRLLI